MQEPSLSLRPFSARLLILTALLALAGCSDDPPTGNVRPSLHVPADFPTIQAAIDAAQYGDFIIVSAGTYADLHTRDVAPDRFPGGLPAAAPMQPGVLLPGDG